ncbi:MAG: PilN domain-containing protein [Kiritimatiellae bacterium]|jgi:Tfp pilus assembly protein PilN|nr:PilN domain-containing protein [Kiritimatiellia bacterium]
MSVQLTGIVYNKEFCEWSVATKNKDVFEIVSTHSNVLDSENILFDGLTGDCTFSLSAEHAMLVVVPFPVVEEADELEGMVSLHVDKISPYPFERTYFGYEVIDEVGGSLLVLIAIVPVEFLEDIKPNPKRAKFDISRIEVSSLGWLKLILQKSVLHKHGRQLYVILDEEFPEILVFQNGSLVAVRSLKRIIKDRADNLEQELLGEISQLILSLELEQGAIELTPEVAYIYSPDSASADVYTKLAAADIYKGSILNISELGDLSKGVVERISSEGVELMDMTPETWVAEKKALKLKNQFIYAGVAVLLCWLFIVVGFVMGFSYQSKKVAQLTALNSKLEPQAGLVMSVGRRATEMERYVNNRISSLECLREISELLPEGVELSALSYKKTDGVRIAGMADNVNMVYEFKDKLDSSELFVEVDLQGPQTDRRKGKEIFDITLTLYEESEGGNQ